MNEEKVIVPETVELETPSGENIVVDNKDEEILDNDTIIINGEEVDLVDNDEVTEIIELARKYTNNKDFDIHSNMSDKLRTKLTKEAHSIGIYNKKEVDNYITNFIVMMEKEMNETGLSEDIEKVYEEFLQQSSDDMYKTFNTDIEAFYNKVLPEEIENAETEEEREKLILTKEAFEDGYKLTPFLKLIRQTQRYENGEKVEGKTITKHAIAKFLNSPDKINDMVKEFDKDLCKDLSYRRSILDAIRTLANIFKEEFPVWSIEILATYVMLYCKGKKDAFTKITRYSFVSNAITTRKQYEEDSFEAVRLDHIRGFLTIVKEIWGDQPPVVVKLKKKKKSKKDKKDVIRRK